MDEDFDEVELKAYFESEAVRKYCKKRTDSCRTLIDEQEWWPDTNSERGVTVSAGTGKKCAYLRIEGITIWFGERAANRIRKIEYDPHSEQVDTHDLVTVLSIMEFLPFHIMWDIFGEIFKAGEASGMRKKTEEVASFLNQFLPDE